MHIERALISKIITSGHLEDAIAQGVQVDHFADDECRDLFIFLTDHMRRFKKPPSLDVVKEERPDFDWEHISDELDWVIERFIALVKRRYANEAVLELARACDDPERTENIEAEFLEVSRKLATLVPNKRVNRFVADIDKRITDYEQRADKNEQVGIPFGFLKLDQWTGGIQPHELVTVSAFSGFGKSTFLIAVAFNAWAQGKTPLIISLEMEASMIMRRFDTMAAKLDYSHMKQLKLPEDQIENWRKKAEQIKKSPSEIPVIDSIRNCTPDHIYAETVRYGPDLVAVDYLNLMRSSRSGRALPLWQSTSEITQDLKQNARTLKVPIIMAAQTNRSGAKEGAELDNIAQSVSIIQDSDIVIGLHTDDDMRAEKTIQVRLNKNRDGRIDSFLATWDYDQMQFKDLNSFMRKVGNKNG